MSEIQNSNDSRDLYSETPIKGLENIQNKALVIAPFEITKSGLLDTDLMLDTAGQITFYLYRKYATDDIDKLIDLEPTSDQFENIKTISELGSLGLVPDNSVGAAGEKDYLGSFKMNVIFKYDKATGTRTIEKDSTYYNQQALDYTDVSVTNGDLNDFSSLVDSHGTGAFFCVCRVEKQTKATNTAFTDGSETYANYEFIFMIPSSECRDLSSSNPIVNSYDILDSNNKVINIMKQGSLGSRFVLDDNTNTPIDPSTSADFFGDGSNIATYLFEGNARDENLNYNGTATNITYALANNPKFGPGNGCAVFNGTSSKISNSTLPVSDSMTISFWMNKSSFANDYECYINLGQDNSSTYKYLTINRQASTNTFRLDIGNGGGSGTCTVPLTITNTISTDGLWHHYTAVWNKTTNRVTFYKDGIPEYLTTDINGYNAVGAVGCNIGWNGYNTAISNGSIDQVRIFNRALNNDEVQALYNNCINKYVVKQEPDQNINDINYDFFEDGTNVGTFRFNGNANEVQGRMIPTVSGNITFSGNTQIDSGSSGSVVFPNPFTSNTVTISAWVLWNGLSGNIPFFLNDNSLWFSGGYLGLSSNNGDQYGFSSTGFANTWKYITLEFTTGTVGKIYVNGVLQTLTKIKAGVYTSRSTIGGTFEIFPAYGTNFGAISNLRLFNRSLTQDEVTALYTDANSTASRPKLLSIKSRNDFFKDGSNIATYLFNGDVTDANGNYNGTVNGVVTYEDGKFGQALHQEGLQNYTDLNLTPNFGTLSLSFWAKGYINISNYRYKVSHYTFSLTTSLNNVNLSLRSSTSLTDGVVVYSISKTDIVDNTKFNHICVTINYPNVVLYINNIAYVGTMNNPAASSSYSLGLFDINNSIQTNSYSEYNGSIDTLRIFNRALNALEVQALYNEQPSVEDQYKLVESSNSTKVLTKNGNPLIRHEPENGPAIKFNNIKDYLTTPGTSDFAFGNGDFTIETWVKFTTAPTSGTTQYICGLDTSNGILFGYENGSFVFYTQSGGIMWIYYPHLPTNGIWYHFAVARQNGITKLFINGIQVASTTNTKYVTEEIGTFYIGVEKFYGSPLKGWMKQLHIIKGVAKYSTNFTPSHTINKTAETVLLVEVQKPTFNTDKISKIELTTTDTSSLPIKVKDNRAKDPFGDKSCVASYLFDSNCNDEVNGLSGLYGTTDINLSYGEGKNTGSKALVFNGINSGLTLSKPLIGTNTTYNFSFNFKIDTDTPITTIYCENYGTGGIWPNGFFDLTNNNELQLRIHNGTVWNDYIVATGIQKGTWYSLVVCCVANNLNLYVNGVKTFTGVIATKVDGGGTLNYGFSNGGNGVTIVRTFKGSISNLKIFNRALTQDEVTYLYNEKALVTEVTPVSTPNQLKIDKAVFELPVSSGGYTYLGKLQFWLNNLALQIQGIKVTHLDGILKLNNIQIGTIIESTAWRDNGVGDYDAHNILLSDINNGNGTTNNIAQTVILNFTTPIIIDKISYLSYAAGLGGSNITTKLYYNSNLVFSNIDTTSYSTTRELNLITTYSSNYTFTTNEPAQKFYLDANSTSRISNLTFKTYGGSDASKQGYRVYPNITIKDRPDYNLTNTPASKKYYLGAKYKRNILDILQQGLKSKRSIYNLKNMYLVNDQCIQTLNKINILLENTNMIKLTERLYSNGITEKVNAEYILENLTQTGTAPNSKIGTILKDSLLIDYSTTFSQSEIDNLEANLNTFKNRARVTPGLVSVVNNKFKLQLPKTLDDGNRTGPGTGTEMRDNLLVFGSPSNIDKYGMAAQNGGTLPHSHIVKRDTPLNLDNLILGNPTLNSLNFKGLTSDIKFALDGSNIELVSKGVLSGALIRNSPVKYNPTSIYLGPGSTLTAPLGGFNFGAGDFTVEAWIYPLEYSNMPLFTVGQWRTSCYTAIYFLGNGNIRFQYGYGGWRWDLDKVFDSNNAKIPVEAWTHFSLQRKSGVLEIFINGIKNSTTPNTTTFGVGGEVYLGGYFDDYGQTRCFISDFHTIIGRAKYSNNFTPNTLKPVKETFKSLQTDYKQQIPFTVIPLSTNVDDTNIPVFDNLTDITGFSSNNDIIIDVPSTL